ncbi:8-amino-7-oxononanoate synthase [Methylibium sp.]|uniref:8-amino-7-oxononanoate synthase n=1 Tax=Methylibium sp. TaxID=2067992 RepID=UPI003D0AEDD8
MPDITDVFEAAVAALDAQQLRRHRRVVAPLDGARVQADGQPRLAFAGNDYLGLSQHPALIEAAQRGAARYGVGATASPLICGHSPAHEALEQELARFVGLPRALYFYAGYAANTGAIPALVERGDALISDALNHACLIDGARLSRAELTVYPHNDLAALERALVASRGARRRLVVVDAVFSMDGDLAPLPEMLALCERFDAWLYVDDAHGFGVLGEGGRGSLSHWGLDAGAMPSRLIYMATLGKAAGVAGAFVAGAPALIEWLTQRARTFFFATGAPPMIAEALRASLQVIEAEGWRRERLLQLRARLSAGLAVLPWPAPASQSAIQPLLLGDNGTALAVMAALDARGIWVPAIRPPTVPEGTARLRISLSAAHTLDDVDRLCAALAEAGITTPPV